MAQKYIYASRIAYKALTFTLVFCLTMQSPLSAMETVSNNNNRTSYNSGNFLKSSASQPISNVTPSNQATLRPEPTLNSISPKLIALEETILKVTQAEPDIKRQVYYKWSSTIYPKWKDSGLFRGSWNGLWMTLKDPEELIDKDALDVGNLFSQKAILAEDHTAFKPYKKISGTLESFTKVFHDSPLVPAASIDDKNLIKTGTESLKAYYSSFIEYIISKINTGIEKSDTTLLLGIGDLLDLKALMMGDLFIKHHFYRISQKTARHLLSLDGLGQPIAKEDSSSTNNHRVSFLPTKDQGPQQVFFKSDGHPSIQPGKEALVFALYEALGIRMPASGLLLLDHIKVGTEYSKEPYILQASEAILGKSGKTVLQADDCLQTLSGLDRLQYAQQVVGALLTDPCDGKPDNFIYNPATKSFISIDNDEVFATTLHKDGRVHLKSALLTLPLMDESLSSDVWAWFITPSPELAMLSWLERVDGRNNAYQRLKQALLFNQTNKIKEGVAQELVERLFAPEQLSLPIRVSATVYGSVFNKLKQSYELFKSNKANTLHTLFDRLDPLLANYYQALRQRSQHPYRAIEVLYNVAAERRKTLKDVPQQLEGEHGKDYSLITSLLTPSLALTERVQQAAIGQEEYLQDIRAISQQLRNKDNWQLYQIDPILLHYMIQWRQKIIKEDRLLEDLTLLANEEVLEIKEAELAIKFWRQAQSTLKSKIWLDLFQPFIKANPEVQWLHTIETHFPNKWGHKESYPKTLSELKGVKISKRNLSDKIKDRLFDANGNFKKDPNLTGRLEVTFYPEQKPLFFFKRHPELPGFEYAASSFMRRFGVEGIPYCDLLMFYHPQQGHYPVLLQQAALGNPVYKIWDQDKNFASLDPHHTGLLTLAAMLVNPEDWKEDNLILSSDKRRLIPIDNDHMFLPGAIRDTGSLTTGYKIYEDLQAKALIFCLDEMTKPLPESVINKITPLNVDEFLYDWMNELVKVNGAYQVFFNKDSDEARKISLKFWKDHNVNLEMPFTELYLTNLYYKFHQMQSLLKENPKILPIDLLFRLEPYVGKKYQQALNTYKTVKDRFKHVTDLIYTKTNAQGSRVSVANSRTVMEIMKAAPKNVLGDPSVWQGGPVYALQYIMDLKKQAKTSLYASILAGKGEVKEAHDCSAANESQEKKYLTECRERALPQEDWAIYQSRVLNTSWIETLFVGEKGERVRFLDLRGAKRGDIKALDVISLMCPNLEYLNISDWSNLDTIAKVTLFPFIGKPVLSQDILFPYLKRLLANNCPKLTNIQVNLPQLRILEIKDTKKTSLDLNIPLLEILDITGYQQEPDLINFKIKDFWTLKLQGIRTHNNRVPMAIDEIIFLDLTNIQGWANLWHTWYSLQHNQKKLFYLLDLNNRKISAEKAVTLVKNIITWANLQTLNLARNSIGAEGAKALAQNTAWINLQTLYLGSNSIGDEGIKALSTNTSWAKLQELNLSFNSIGDEGIKALSTNTSWINLHTLNLGYNSIRAEGAKVLSTNTSWSNLQTLNLGGNSIKAEGAKALSTNTSWINLHTLNLGYNSIGAEGAKVLSTNTAWINLQDLDLSSNFLGDEGAKALAQNTAWTNLQSLDLSRSFGYSSIGDEGKKALVSNPYWKKLKEENIKV